MGGQIAPGRHDPRPVEQAGADRIADRQADLAGVARRADRGEAGRGDLLREEHAAQGAELERAVEVDVLLALGVAVGEVGVDVDQPGHHEVVGIVEHPITAGPPRRPASGAGIVDHRPLVEDQDLAGRASSSRPVKSWPQRTKVFIAVDSFEETTRIERDL